MQESVIDAAASGIEIVPVEQAKQVALDAGLPEAQADAVASDYGDAELEALERSLGAVAIFALLAFWFTRRLPGDQPRATKSRPSAPGPRSPKVEQLRRLLRRRRRR